MAWIQNAFLVRWVRLVLLGLRYYLITLRIARMTPGVDRRVMPSFTMSPIGDGSPHVETRDGVYYYVHSERGKEFERRRTEDLDELLYWLVSDAVFGVACTWECQHRVHNQDHRRQLFAKELEIMARFSQRWAARKRVELDEVLKRHPYDDALYRGV